MVAGRPGVRQVGGRRCLVISLIMSPHNCNETLSPSKDGDDESERVPMSESDRECNRRKVSLRSASCRLQLTECQVQRLKRRYQSDSVDWVQHGNCYMPWAVSPPRSS